MFADEFMDGVDHDSIERLHRGDVQDWVDSVARSGLFMSGQVARAEATWRHDPKSLLDALLSEADEMTAKRCELIWSELDRVEGRPQDLVTVGGYSNVVASLATTIA
ncbi:hypothetical protein EF834_00355 [Rhodococcus spongiicola]|uniref:Uncharacterized protein n=2 Tax=Rhodococcus spongiicola TaxID=2487352 RepID=A0A438B6W3_9NOCA|nr:hypothetical protein [Rhodococcus spongiicola]RVW06697.1 hypothetical protein EF834_00355 [Rhodococcus spongiicola]